MTRNMALRLAAKRKLAKDIAPIVRANEVRRREAFFLDRLNMRYTYEDGSTVPPDDPRLAELPPLRYEVTPGPRGGRVYREL